MPMRWRLVALLRTLRYLFGFIFALLVGVLPSHFVQASDVFIYSSQSDIRGVDLTQGTDRILTTSPIASSVNALAYNLQAGIVYYGDQTSVYRWTPALGSGATAHTLMNDFSVGPLTAPITNINSTGGSYLNGSYYVGSEGNTGYIQELYELRMSTDGTQVVSVTPLNLLDACACTSVQLGGFGDIAAIDEGGVTVLFGSSADLSGIGQGTIAGRWKFTPSLGTFQFLSTGSGGQLSASPSGVLYTNVGNAIREVNTQTGAISNSTLFTTSASIFDFTGGFALDYGDAPDSYGSAYHRLGQVSTAYIGSLAPDNEAGSLNATSAAIDGAGDDNDGIDDEDALNAPVSVSTLTGSYSITVQCTPGSRLAGWIDTNINGVFDSNERNANHPVSCAAGQANLTWSGLFSAVTGNTYLRLRASTNASAISRPIGVASDGEVEDHPVVITGGGASSGSCPAGSTSTIYNANDVPLAIGPNANTTAVSTINVTDTGTLVDVNVLDITGTHTYINDLIFSLRHSGVTRRLYGPSCGSQNDFSFGFDDASSGTPPCPPIDGNSYPSRQSLSNFNGQSVTGSWQLRIRDRFNGDGGSLSNWQLELCTSGTSSVEVPDLVLGKQVLVNGRELAMRFVLANTGNVTLSGVSLIDDLDSVLGVGSYQIPTAPVLISGPTGASVNVRYNGSSDTQLLSDSVTLAAGEQIVVELTVLVDVITATASPGAYANQALASGTSPSGVLVNDLSGSGLAVSTDTDDPTLFELNSSTLLTGSVYVDTSISSATSHDGLRQPDELGVAGRIIRVVDENDVVLATTSTDADGQWQLQLEPESVNQLIRVRVQPDTASVFISEDSTYSGLTVTDGELQTQLNYGAVVNNLNVGVITQPLLVEDQSRTVTPGTQVVFPHQLTVNTHGILNLSISQSTTPANNSWLSEVQLDVNCNQLLDTPDVPVGSPIVVQPDDVICLLVVSSVPSTATDGNIALTGLNAQLVVSDDSGTDHAVIFDISNTDVTTVIRPGAGRLELTKSVRNVTLGGAPLTANSARPGHVLEYDLAFINAGNGPLTELLIDDAAPPFTTILPATVVCDSTPGSLTCTPAVSGASVSWSFTGALLEGQGGRVVYQVIVD